MKNILLIAFTIISTTLIAQSWTQVANFPQGRHHPVTFALNGKGYSLTGTNSTNGVTRDAYQYNPVNNTWRRITDFPGAARSFAISVISGGRAYMGFGFNGSSAFRDLWRFNPIDSSWTRLADCPCQARLHPAMIAIGNYIYVGLGNGSSGNLNDFWRYDISSNTWISISNLPGPARHHPFMFSAGGSVYAGMGHGNTVVPNTPNVFRDWYKLDTANNSWTRMRDFPGQARVAGTQFDNNGFGYVLSGDGSNHSTMTTGEIWRYNTVSDSWLQLPAHPGVSRWAPGSFVINDEVYFFGGLNRVIGLFPVDAWKLNLNSITVSLDEDIDELSNTYAYPNPVSNTLYWENDNSINHVKVYSAMGQLIFESPSTTKRMDVSNYEDGLYFVQFFENTELVKTTKIVVQNGGR